MTSDQYYLSVQVFSDSPCPCKWYNLLLSMGAKSDGSQSGAGCDACVGPEYFFYINRRTTLKKILTWLQSDEAIAYGICSVDVLQSDNDEMYRILSPENTCHTNIEPLRPNIWNLNMAHRFHSSA